MSAVTGLAKAGGTRLYYESAGEGSPVVLIHAGVADSRMWDEQFEAFTRSHLVVRYDLRGFGRSPLPGGPFSHVRDLRSLLRFLGIERAALVGASFGGRIALEFSLAYPDVVEALVLAPAQLPNHEWSEDVRRFGAEEDAALERGDLDHAVELNLRMWVEGPQRGPNDVNPALRERARGMQLDAFRTQVAAFQRTPPPGPEDEVEPPASARLTDITAPTLLLVGAKDVADFVQVSEILEAGIPGAKRVVLPDVAHLVSMERPDEFNDLVLDFLSED